MASSTARPRRHRTELTVAEMRSLKSTGNIDVAEINREEIVERPRGDCSGFWDSLRKGIDADRLLGYSLEDSTAVSKAFSSHKFAGVRIHATDFGHRFRWLTRPDTEIVFADGHTLATLRTEMPDDYAYLMNTTVPISISTHPDKDFLLNFVKEEYEKVNTTSMPMEGGELARCLPEMPTRVGPEEMAEDIINEFFEDTPSDRDNRRLLAIAAVNGVTKGMDYFHQRMAGDDNILNVARSDLTADETEIATSTLAAFAHAMAGVHRDLVLRPSADLGEAEEAVATAKQEKTDAPRGEEKAAASARLVTAETELKRLKKEEKARSTSIKKQKELLKKKDFNFKNHGPVLFGLRDAVLTDRARGDGEATAVDTAIDVVQRWMKMSLVDKAVWTKNHADVASKYGENNGPRYYNEQRFKAGWTRMKSMIV
jgi:hypothetical protein